MPRKRPQKRTKLSPEDVMKARGYTDKDLESTERHTEPPPDDIERTTILGRRRVRDVFGKMLGHIGGSISIGGIKVSSWEDAVGPESPDWNEALIRTFITVYLATRKPRKSGKLHQSTLNLFVLTTFGAYQHDKGVAMCSSSRIILLRTARDLGAKHGLRQEKTPRAALSPQSVIDLLSAIAVLDHPVRYRLSLMAYSSVAAVTGLRASSLLRSFGKTRDFKRRCGITWKDMQIWILPSADQSTPNDLVIYLKPRWAKTYWGSATTFPLLSGPHLASSANMLVALLGDMDKAFEVSLEKALDPKFCKTSGASKPRRLRVCRSRLDDPVFASLSNARKSMTVGRLNEALKRSSWVAGFRGKVTSHAFRYLVCQEVFSKFGLDVAREVLGHGPKSAVVKTYLGPSMPFGTGSAIAGDAVDYSLIGKSTRGDTNADWTSRKSLTDKELEQVLADPEVVELRREQKEISQKIAAEYGSLANGPVELRRKYKELAGKYNRTVTAISEKIINTERKEERNKKNAEALQPQSGGSTSGGSEIASHDSGGSTENLCNFEVVISTGIALERDKPEILSVPEDVKADHQDATIRALLLGLPGGVLEMTEKLQEVKKSKGLRPDLRRAPRTKNEPPPTESDENSDEADSESSVDDLTEDDMESDGSHDSDSSLNGDQQNKFIVD